MYIYTVGHGSANKYVCIYTYMYACIYIHTYIHAFRNVFSYNRDRKRKYAFIHYQGTCCMRACIHALLLVAYLCDYESM